MNVIDSRKRPVEKAVKYLFPSDPFLYGSDLYVVADTQLFPSLYDGQQEIVFAVRIADGMLNGIDGHAIVTCVTANVDIVDDAHARP